MANVGRKVIVEFLAESAQPVRYEHVGQINIMGPFVVLFNVAQEPIALYNMSAVKSVVHPDSDTELIIPAL